MALLEWLIRSFTLETELILDCFSGSGSTALACKNLNRNFIGCEVNEIYYEKSVERINENNKLQLLK